MGTLSRHLAFSPDGRTLASGYGNAVYLWDSGTGELQRTLRVDGAISKSLILAYSAAGWLRVAARRTTGSSLYRETNGELVRREADLHGLSGVWRECEFSKDGSLLAVIGHNYKIALYDTATGQRRLAPRPRRET